MMREIEKYLKRLETHGICSECNPHGGNILHKAKTLFSSGKISTKNVEAINRILPLYLRFYVDLESKAFEPAYLGTQVLNDYYNALRLLPVNPFSHQSDFLSSIVPEFLTFVMKSVIQNLGSDLLVSTQKDIPIDIMFDARNNGMPIVKTKRVDVCAFLDASFMLNEARHDFIIPVIAIEVKTNLDKNMLSGIESSVESLKMTFPNSSYFAVTEFCDFAVEEQNYSGTHIDEVYILRRQKRSSFRAQQKFNKSYPGNPIDLNVIKMLYNNFVRTITLTSNEVPLIGERLSTGTLINKGRD